MNYLIWSNEHNAWWRANSQGYTSTVENAGRYSLNDAVKICNDANHDWNIDKIKNIPNEIPVSEESALLLKNRNEV